MLVQRFNDAMAAINAIVWHPWVFYAVLGTGILFTVWSRFCQWRALTHGIRVLRGDFDDADDPGAISHFQALSAALSATVGLGNIAGVAVAIGLGGPGAIFYMWIIGILGMAIKTTEVNLSMLYRNTDDPDNPHGGPMFVARAGLAERSLAPLGSLIGGIFVVTLLTSAVTGGNMFQSWNVAEVTQAATGVPRPVVGIVLAALVGLVIIGGVKRIGAVAGRLVPMMVALYLLAALYVLALNIHHVPEMFALIFRHAFAPTEAAGAFTGATAGVAFSWGMQRALFSSEVGQGSSPIAHCAARTDEPTREAVVAGLEPFIDTIVVCTLTALVILASGAWNRGHEAAFGNAPPEFVRVVVDGVEDDGTRGVLWTLRDAPDLPVDPAALPRAAPGSTLLPAKSSTAARISGPWSDGEGVFVMARVSQTDAGGSLVRLQGTVRMRPTPAGTTVAAPGAGAPTGAADADGDSIDPAPGAANQSARPHVEWQSVRSQTRPRLDAEHRGVYADYVGGSLTTHAFDRVAPGLGTWLVLVCSWLFALSTQISWSYYGEQGVVFLFGNRGVLPYKVIYCLLIVVATLGFIRTTAELNNFTSFGTGVMLWANIPILLLFGGRAMRGYHDYFRRMGGRDD